MNILVINGSPKGTRSNSMKLTEAFLRGMSGKYQETGEAVCIEQIDVNKTRIEGCRGCFACWKVTPGKCCINDDMQSVIEKELWADVIVFSFPLYYFNVPGKLKNLIDRQLPMVLPFMSEREDGIGSGSHDARYDMSGKKYVLVSTCGFYSAAGNYDSVRGMFDHICGKDRYETVFCGQGELFSIKELSQRTDAYLQVVESAGAEFADGAVTSKTRSKLEELLFEKEVFEKMADASWGVDRKSGEKEDESLIFTRQMAAMYNKKNYDGKDRVLEMYYTDLGKTYQIALTKNGSEVITDGHLKYTTRIETPYSVWLSIAQNEIRGDEALAKQMYRVIGDFSFMLKWDVFFSTDTEKQQSADEEKKTVQDRKKKPAMATMLLAWIVFWVAVSMDAQSGALISMAVSAALPMLMMWHELTVYDRISITLTALLSIFTLVTGQGALFVNIGYLFFGLMWLLSCLTKEPVCAAYVKYDYNGEDALNNPIFMKTNYILAAGWGILYVIIAVWTWFLSKTAFASGLVILNNVMPILMGIFTGWFQKWYPAWVAGGGSRFKA